MQGSPSIRILSRLSTVQARRVPAQYRHLRHYQQPPHNFTQTELSTRADPRFSFSAKSTGGTAATAAAAAAVAALGAMAVTYGSAGTVLGNCEAPTKKVISPPALHDGRSDAKGDRDQDEDRNDGDDDEKVVDWKSLIAALREAQRADTLGSGFRAVRRPITNAGSTTAGWAHEVDFPLLRDADLYGLVTALVQGLGGVGDTSIRVEDSGTRRQIILRQAEAFEAHVSVPRVTSLDGRVSISVRKALHDGFSEGEVHGIVTAYRSSQTSMSNTFTLQSPHLLDGKLSVDVGPPTHIERDRRRQPKTKADGRFVVDDKNQHESQVSKNKAREKLEQLGVEVFGIDEHERSSLTWDALAGYKDVKQRIEDTLTLPLQHPEVYDSIMRGTRRRAETNVPKAVLYEGPPGCGKTLSARILAATIGIPFVHVRVETLLSKYYGETTRKMSEVLETANALGRCIVFLDECDSVGLHRSGSGGGSGSSDEVHEVTRRTLSVLLRFIDGMDGAKDAIILAATNHKEDLDAALVSRFDVIVSFPLPDHDTRAATLRLYAKQLPPHDLDRVARLTWGFSGRELVDVCEEAERTRAGIIVRQQFKHTDDNDNDKGNKHEQDRNDKSNDNDASESESVILPTVQDYVEAVERKAEHVVGRWNQRFADRDALQKLIQDANQATPPQQPEATLPEPQPISTES